MSILPDIALFQAFSGSNFNKKHKQLFVYLKYFKRSKYVTTIIKAIKIKKPDV
jgi:hypothetical protein